MKEASISVGSATEYENLIAEIKFGRIAGAIISKEPNDIEYKISVYSFGESSTDNFDYNRNDPSEKLNLSLFLSSVKEAVTHLDKLDRADLVAPDKT